MKVPFPPQLFTELLSNLRALRESGLEKDAYLQRIRQLFLDAGLEKWYGQRWAKLCRKKPQRCLGYHALRGLTYLVRQGLVPAAWLAKAWVQHAVCRMGNVVDLFQPLKAQPRQVGRELCLVVTCAEARGELAPPLAPLLRELAREYDVAVLLLGDHAEAGALAEHATTCLRLPGELPTREDDLRFADIAALLEHLRPACIVSDTHRVLTRVTSAACRYATTIGTFYTALDFPLFYEWEGVAANHEQREWLERAFRCLHAAGYADAAVAASYRERLAYDVPPPHLLPPGHGACHVQELLRHAGALRQRQQHLAERLRQHPFPLWEKVDVEDELSRCRQRMEVLKPCYGFHPLMYADAHGLDALGAIEAFLETPQQNYPSVRVDTLPQHVEAICGRVALHIHAFYPDVLEEMLTRLKLNVFLPDLFISATESGQAACRAACARHGLEADIRVFPNAGRDLGAFLTGFAEEWQHYELVGHLHTKKTPQSADASFVERWNQCIYANLLGHKGLAVTDRVLTYLAQHPECGLFFPEPLRCWEWNANYALGQQLMETMGYGTDLPRQLVFPGGTMFWCRPAALRGILSLRPEWKDYPAEPLNTDGTWLHAMERLFPLVAQKEGYGYVASHARGYGF